MQQAGQGGTTKALHAGAMWAGCRPRWSCAGELGCWRDDLMLGPGTLLHPHQPGTKTGRDKLQYSHQPLMIHSDQIQDIALIWYWALGTALPKNILISWTTDHWFHDCFKSTFVVWCGSCPPELPQCAGSARWHYRWLMVVLQLGEQPAAGDMGKLLIQVGKYLNCRKYGTQQ